MRRTFVILFFLTLTMTMYSQKTDTIKTTFSHKNSVQVELFGHGLCYSFNYERVIFNCPKFKTTGQSGFSYYPPKTGIIVIWIPILINELISFNKHHIEFGLGYVCTDDRMLTYKNDNFKKGWGGFISARIGYRYQKPNGRLIIRLGFTPFLEYRDAMELHPSGGLAMGYNF